MDELSKKTAYEMGYELGKELATTWKEMDYQLHDGNIITPDGEIKESGEAIGEWWECFTQYAEYSNLILPDLRFLAGFKDTIGVGTYTDGGEDEDFNLQELSEEYDKGIHNGFEYVFKQSTRDNKVTVK